MAVVNMRSVGGKSSGALPPPALQFRYRHCVPILVPIVLDRFHNLKMNTRRKNERNYF